MGKKPLSRGRADSPTVKATFTLPGDMFIMLGYCAERMGVTQSAMLTMLLRGSLPELAQLIEEFPPNGAPLDVKRLRGRSREVIEERFSALMSRLGEDD